MTFFTAAWTWTLLRSLLLVVLALPCCGLLVRWINSSSRWKQRLQWSLLSIPFLFPELLTGYAYGQMTRLLISDLWAREFWFDLLLFLRMLPVGTGLWYCSPPSPLSREAIHARVLAFRNGESLLARFSVRLWYELHGPARTALFAGSGLFLATFQEFELASLLAVTSWTVWLFDAQAQGLSLWDSLKYIAIPAVFTWIACGSLPWFFLKTERVSASQTSRPGPLSTMIQLGLGICLILACTLVAIYPVFLIGCETAQGLYALVFNAVQFRGLVEGILIAGGSALIATVLADLLAEALVTQIPPQGVRRIGLLTASLGMCGPLAISLMLLALFQQPGFVLLRETPVPALCGLVIWLLPRAVVLQGIRRSFRSDAAEHSIELLRAAPDFPRQAAARQLTWLVRDRSQFAARVLLFHWAYWDLTLSSLLNPAGLVAAPVRLYIDAHFARNALLTAKAGLMLLAPILLLAIWWGAGWFWNLLRITNASRNRHPH
jgi:hypothetical protein